MLLTSEIVHRSSLIRLNNSTPYLMLIVIILFLPLTIYSITFTLLESNSALKPFHFLERESLQRNDYSSLSGYYKDLLHGLEQQLELLHISFDKDFTHKNNIQVFFGLSPYIHENCLLLWFKKGLKVRKTIKSRFSGTLLKAS